MTAEEQKAEETDTAPRPRQRRRRRRFMHHVLRAVWIVVTIVVVVLLGAGFYIASGRAIDAPAWVEERIERRAAEAFPEGQVRFNRLQLVVVEGLKPRLRFVDLRLEDAGGQQIVGFSQLDTELVIESLFEGRIEPREILVSGIFATLRRSADGALSLSGGYDIAAPARQAPSLAALFKTVDDLLLQPQMRRLETIDIQALTLRYEDVASGRAWTIDGGRAQLARDGIDVTISTDLALLSGADSFATMTGSYQTVLGGPAARFGATIENFDAADIAAQGPAFAWLGALRAPISGTLQSGIEPDGALSPLNATLSIGEGAVQPVAEARPIPFTSARAAFAYDPGQQELRFDEIAVDSKWVRGQAEGVAWLGGLERGGLSDLVAQLSVTELAVNPFEVYPSPRHFPSAWIDMRLTLDPFRLEVGQAVVDLDGEKLVLSGDLSASTEGWGLALDGFVRELSPTRVIDLWPEAFAARTRSWLDENLIAARLRNANVALRAAPGAKVESHVSVDYDQAEIRYMQTMPHLKDGRGYAALAADRLVVSVDAGAVTAPEGGQLDVSGSAFIVEDTSTGPGTPATILLQSDSSLQAAFSIIDQPPLNILQKVGRDPSIASGQALIEGEIRLPLRKGVLPEDIDYAISGQLASVASETLVPTRRLEAPSLILDATPDFVVIGGPGTLDGVPFEAAWSQALGPDQTAPGEITGTLQISDATLTAFGVDLPPGSVRGETSGDIRVSLPRDGVPQFEMSSDTRGATLALLPIGWRKPAATTGELRLAGTLGETPTIETLTLNAPGLTATGRVDLRPGGALAEARFSRVRVGNWFDAPVRLVGRGSAPPEVRVTGGRLDLRQATFGEGGGETGPITLSLDRLQISDSIALENFAGQFSEGRGLNGRFSARLNGGASVEGRVVPQNGRSAIRMTSSDGGGVLAASGIMKQARGGDLTLTLLPVQGAAGVMDGRLQIANARVRNAPVMAELLSAISIVGLLDQLGGNGITFNTVDAEFRLTPSQVVLERASAVGPSMGISMEGRYAMENGAMDMQGVISPVYFLNAIGQVVSRRGEGLIGFNYRVRGSAEDPRVQVNPLSALTPGFFREIFRAKPPDLPAADAPRALVPTELAPRAATPEASAPKKKPGQIASEER